MITTRFGQKNSIETLVCFWKCERKTEARKCWIVGDFDLIREIAKVGSKVVNEIGMVKSRYYLRKWDLRIVIYLSIY